MGKVSHPHFSGVLTTSLVISLHDLQTEAQATTSLRAGQEISLASTRWTMSRSNSWGKFAQGLCWINVEDDDNCVDIDEERSGAMCDFALRCICVLSTLLDIFPMVISLNSRTMLLNGILIGVTVSIQGKEIIIWKFTLIIHKLITETHYCSCQSL